MNKIKFVKNIHCDRLALYLILLLCAWAVLAIQLKISCLSIPVNWSHESCNNLNQLYINLTYSFLAGYVFYLLTIYFPQKTEKKRLQPVIIKKTKAIKKELENVLLEFSRGTDTNDYMKTESARKVLMSKNWTDNMPMYQKLYNANISYIAFIGEVGKLIQKNIVELIQSYQRFMTTEQIGLLEELPKLTIFSLAQQFSKMPISLEDENGKKSLVDFFIKALEKMKEIEDSFNIKDY